MTHDPDHTDGSAEQSLRLGTALRIVDEYVEEIAESSFFHSWRGTPTRSLPELSPEEAERRGRLGRDLTARIDALHVTDLPDPVRSSIELVRFHTSRWARTDDWYWLIADPAGGGFFGMFAPTPYCGGMLVNDVRTTLAAHRFRADGDADRYLGLVADLARLVDQFTERTAGQAARGIRLPKAQVAQARGLLAGLAATAPSMVRVDPERCDHVVSPAFHAEIERRTAERIVPAFERLAALLDDTYLDAAPDTVGLGQYPGGAEVYAELVRYHTASDLTPEEVHEIGLRRIERIEAEMAAIRAELGYDGPAEHFVDGHLALDPSLREHTVEGVIAAFQRHIDRLDGVYGDVFHRRSPSALTIAPMLEALQASLTFGYYEPPSPPHDTGTFHFNSSNLTRQPLHNLAALTYHELVPGHHLHISTQQSDLSHPFVQAASFVNAYNEGWAEYAATLAGDLGMYERPADRYGRLVMDAFLSCRLVVDTGMNAFGWSLERARDYLRAHAYMSEREVMTESIRYSCDIPAQALAYKLGDDTLLALRTEMRESLGDRFDLREFHELVLRGGGRPFATVARQVRDRIEAHR
jgi:uncharacterized protein (DUF885 family)